MGWVDTDTGLRIDLDNDPDLEQITIGDIATGLANTCRFTGQLKAWYCVAEHSIKVSELVRPDLAFEALMHDAHEAYLGDITTPVKRKMGAVYLELEDRISLAIGMRFGLGDKLVESNLHEQIKQADRIMVVTERDALRTKPREWGPEYESVMRYPQFRRRYTDPDEAREAFLKRFSQLHEMRKAA